MGDEALTGLEQLEVIDPVQEIQKVGFQRFFAEVWDSFVAFLPSLVAALVVLAIGYIVLRIATKGLRRGLKRSRLDKTLHTFILSCTRILGYTVLVVIVLDMLHVPMTSFITAIGAAGVAIGLALKDSLANFASGLLILVDKPFKVGDYINVDDIEGNVVEIDLMHTKLLTLDNRHVYIPNGNITSQRVINASGEAIRRIDLALSIGYTDDIDLTRQTLLELFAADERALKEPAPCVKVTGHGDNAIAITAFVWCKKEDYLTLRQDMFEASKKAFDRAGIHIPFPQLDVHMVEQ